MELGPGGGTEGGEILIGDWLEGTDTDCKKFDVLSNITTNNNPAVIIPPDSKTKIIRMDDFSALYIKHQSVAFPMNNLIAVCGVSGSGKSTFVNHCLMPYLNDNGKKLGIKHIENLGQKNATRTAISNVGSLLGINDKIAQLYAKASGIRKGNFMINSNEGKCPVCGGKGRIPIEEGVVETCPNCEGRMFSKEVLQNKYQGLNILEFLQTSLKEIIPLVQDDKKLSKLFSLCEQIGVGYLSLSRSSKTLSKGEIQRIKLVNVLSNAEKDNIYILDEPSKGLHPFDIEKLLSIISEIIKSGNTVIAVEHNVDFISRCNYAIEFGPSSGKNGGRVVFSGNVNSLKCADTPTGRALQGREIQIEHNKDFNLDTIDGNVDIQIPNNITIEKNVINYVSVRPIDMDKLFAYTNGEYLKAALPANTFFLKQQNDANQLIGCKTPVIRPVGIGNVSFGKKARIVDALGLHALISRYFMPISLRPVIGKRFVPDAFSPSSSLGKCSICKGTGELEQFDFSLAFSNGTIHLSVEELLRKRTNYTIAKKHLKKDYGLDIFRPLGNLTEEEKTVLLFGDRQRKFYDKSKEYYWEGLNRLVMKELRYMEDKTLAEKIRKSKCVSPCMACNGALLSKTYRNLDRSAVGYNQFMRCSFIDLLKDIKNDISANHQLIRAFEVVVTLGLGNHNCFTKMSNLSKEEQSLIQLAAYLIHPIFDSIIAIDGSIISSCASVEVVLKKMTQNCTVIINKGRE